MKLYPYYTTFDLFFHLIFDKKSGIEINIRIYTFRGLISAHFEVTDGVIKRHVADDFAHELYIGSHFAVFHKRA